ncbi:MAG TPA: TonB-dependent receptor [Vicinamibacterales bacterium]|nr:TonB-dependent receptor [Vicinamibacterales bacterium]
MRNRRMLGSAAAVGLCLTLPALPASAQVARPQPQLVSRTATAASIELTGVVQDRGGKPVVGAVVSAIGAESAFAVSDREGRFTFRSLPAGPYVVRAHLQGYLPARPRVMQIGTTTRGDFTITLVKRSESADTPPVLAAGIGPVDEPVAEQPENEATHEHDELAWRLRHLKRSVLKSEGERVPGLDTLLLADNPLFGLGRAVGESARIASSILADLPLDGQFNLLTTTSFDRPQDLFAPDAALPRSVAFVSLSSPMANGEWRMRGALTQGDLSSWTVAGSYARALQAAHAYQVGFSYGMQRYSGGNAEALAAVRDGGRTVGVLYGYDTWTVVPAVKLEFGGRYANYGYLEEQGLLSPRAGIEVRPLDDPLTLRASVAHRETAPGAEEFIPPAIGVWLPPERTFSPVSRRGEFRPERVDHVEVAAERQMAGDVVVGVRAFRQRGEDQIVTLFGVAAVDGVMGTGHYRVGSAGDFEATGWGVSVSRNVAEGTRASIDYSRAGAEWVGRSPDFWALARLASQVLRRSDVVHDLTATIESLVPATSTRIFVLYKLNTAAATPGFEQASAGGARFDVQINQALPFSVAKSRWEALVAVKNMFHDEFDSRSLYDELLVVRAPTRVLGGVTVKF